MANLAATLYGNKLIQGDVSLYMGTAQQALPTDLDTTADGTLDYTGFTLLDFKETSIKAVYSAEFTDEFVRESPAAIWAWLEKEGFELEFTMKRGDLDVLAYAMSAATLTTVAHGVAQVGQQVLGIGGGTALAYSLLMQVTNAEDYYRLYHFPIIMPVGDVEQEFDRAKSILTPIKFRVFADMTAAAGERLYKVYDMNAPKGA